MRSAKTQTVIGFAILVTLTVVAAVVMSAQRALWYDELFTYYVTREATIGAVLRALQEGVDNLPPLDYLIRHFVVSTFGQDEVTVRLPSALAWALALIALFLQLSRTQSPFAALAGAAVLPSTHALYFAHEARAYAPLLATTLGAIYLWSRTTDPDSRPRHLVLLALCLGACPLLHYYGVLSFLPVLVAEAVLMWKTRRLRRGFVLAMVGAGGITALAIPFALRATAYGAAHWSSVNVGAVVALYEHLFSDFAVVVAASLIVAVISVVWFEREDVATVKSLRAAEIAAAATLAAFPLFVYLVAKFTGAMTQRYAIGATGGVALLVGYALAAIDSERPRVARYVTATVFTLAVYQSARTIKNAWELRGADPAAWITEHLELGGDPVVIESAPLCLQTFHYLPVRLRGRIACAIDPKVAVQYLGYDTDDRAMARLHTLIPTSLMTASNIRQGPRRFEVVVGNGWVTPWLLEQQAHVRLIGTLDTRQLVEVQLTAVP